MPLRQTELDEMKATIDARRKALRDEIQSDIARSRTDSFGTIAGEVPDSGDQAMAALVTDTDNAETNRDIRELQELDAANVRVAEGSYGICNDCGDDIPIARLRAYPGAMRCITCQSVYERTHSHSSEPKL
jgi:phage/conjugal plasmid C-4 type zinc finger TraR family protein